MDSNHRLLESESNALPLGDTPSTMKADKINGVIEGGRTLDLQSHNLAFYQLNYDHHNFWCSQKDSNLRPLP